ncbi:E3 ubiquitin-protein ligase tom1, partial [Cryomyces antarcticus]
MDNPSGSRTSSNDPAQAVSFVPTLTTSRWQDEARLVFGTGYIEMTQRVINSILRRLVPPALEAKRLADKAKEEWERVAAEEKVRREKAEKEKADREKKEKEEAEAEQAAARAREQAEAGPFQEAVVVPETSTESQSMEGVEPTGSASTTAHETAPTAPTAPVERVVIQFHGRELDITDFGIDIEYLNALPEELRDEVITAQVQQQRSQAQAAGEEPSEISREFLEALPDEIREELLRQEGRDRRQRERQEARRRAEANGEVPAPGRGPEEMDAANFLASLDPALRQVVLMEQDLTSLAGMPPEIQAEARAL